TQTANPRCGVKEFAMQLIQQIALVSEVNQISASQLSRASAALQKQLTRDFNPIWQVQATIDAFASLDDVPLTYWPILIQQDIHMNAGGVHLDKNGQPFALVRYSNQWTLTASHAKSTAAATSAGTTHPPTNDGNNPGSQATSPPSRTSASSPPPKEASAPNSTRSPRSRNSPTTSPTKATSSPPQHNPHRKST